MRLVCPNCGAQYEVDDRVMPEAGRDVQCSNCGHAWFFTPPKPATSQAEVKPEPKIEMPAPLAPSIEEAFKSDPAPAPTPEETPSVEACDEGAEPEEADAESADAPIVAPEEADADDLDTGGQDEAPTEVAAEPDADEGDEDTEDTPIPTAAAPRKEVSDEVKQILQEEAEQELRAREAENQALETQPDLGLDTAQRDNDAELAARLKQMEDEANAALEEDADEKDLRSRDMLPDIEEINSTLDAPDGTDDTRIDLGPMGGDTASGGKGFRRGFSLTILLAILLVCVYVLAPQISERFPQAQGVLEQYTALGDSARLWLESAMQSAIEKMRGLMDSASEG